MPNHAQHIEEGSTWRKFMYCVFFSFHSQKAQRVTHFKLCAYLMVVCVCIRVSTKVAINHAVETNMVAPTLTNEKVVIVHHQRIIKLENV